MVPYVPWTALFVLGVLVIWRADRYYRAKLALSKQEQESAEADRVIKRMERQNAAELAQRTLDETAELEKAEKLQKAAEARTAAALAEDPSLHDARIAEEQRVIEARAEGRALAAKERAVKQGDSASDIAVLTKSYDDYRAGMLRSGIAPSNFGNWVGNVLQSK